MKKVISVILFTAMVLFSVTAAAATGSGTEDAPYIIANEADLLWFAEQVNSGNNEICAKLTANIGISESWTPIGHSTSVYKGTFDGNGKFVSGIDLHYEPETTQMSIGLFGYNEGTIKNVTVKDSNLSASVAGAICAYNYKNGRIEGCTSYAEVGALYAGGICSNNSGKITDCTNYGYIYGLEEVYGIVGDEEVTRSELAGGICADSKGDITSCVNYGNIFMSACYNPGDAGGISASTDGGTISYCENQGEVVSAGNAGGIVYYLNNTTIDRCINYVSVSAGKEYAGGIAGMVSDSTLSNSINYGDVGGNSDCGGIAGYLSSRADGCVNFGRVSGLSRAGGVAAKYEGDGKARASYSLNGLVTIADENAQQTDPDVNVTEEILMLPETAWLMNTANGEEENCGAWAEGAVFADTTNNKAVYRVILSGKDSGALYSDADGKLIGLDTELVYVTVDNGIVDENTVITADMTLTAKDLHIISVEFEDENSEKPYDIPIGKVYAKVTVAAPESGTDINVIVAEYENGELVDITATKENVTGIKTVIADIQVDGMDMWGDGSEFLTWYTDLKIFVWNGGFAPLFNSVGYYD